MQVCSACPYPAKCTLRGRCVAGNEVAAPKPAPVVEKAAPKTVKKKKVK